MDLAEFIETKKANGWNPDKILDELAEGAKFLKKKLKIDGREIVVDNLYLDEFKVDSVPVGAAAGSPVVARFDSEMINGCDRGQLINYLVENTSSSQDFYEGKMDEYLVARYNAVVQSKKAETKLTFVPDSPAEPKDDRVDAKPLNRAEQARLDYINRLTKKQPIATDDGHVAKKRVDRNSNIEDIVQAADSGCDRYLASITKGRYESDGKSGVAKSRGSWSGMAASKRGAFGHQP